MTVDSFLDSIFSYGWIVYACIRKRRLEAQAPPESIPLPAHPGGARKGFKAGHHRIDCWRA